MFADVIIAEARDDLKRHSAETMAPKFWDSSRGEVRMGVRRRSAREVLKEIDAAQGVYPVVSSVTLEPRVPQWGHPPAAPPLARPVNANNRSKPGRTCRDLYDFARDREASISLWAVPLDHVSVPESERRGELQVEGEEQQTASNGEHAPNTQDVSTSRCKAIRIALDFRMSTGGATRRTGTILLRSQKSTGNPCRFGDPEPGPIGWSVCWDRPKWFAGARVGLSIPMPLIHMGSGSGTPSNPIEIEDEDSRFVLLVWKGNMPKLKVAGNVGPDWSIVPMLFKKQDGGQSVQFTEEEKCAFGIGLSEDKVMADFESARRWVSQRKLDP